MSAPLVSAIVPVHNGERFLQAALQSIADQEYHPCEMVVVDDGSTDRSAGIAKSFRGVRYVHQAQQGNAAARNTGIRCAEGQFLAFLDQDDAWAPNKLRIQTGYLIRHPDIQYVLARCALIREPGINIPDWCRDTLFEEAFTDYTPGSLMARRSAFERVGDFDVTFASGSDAEWFFRAKDLGTLMAVLEDVLLYRRVHDSNQSADVPLGHKELLRVVGRSMTRKIRMQMLPGAKRDGGQGSAVNPAGLK